MAKPLSEKLDREVNFDDELYKRHSAELIEKYFVIES